MTEKEIHGLIGRTFGQGGDVVVGPGDDCAVLDFGTGRYFLIAVDQLVSDVHYVHKNTPPARAAAKLLNRNLSDIAAMGGEPSFGLLTIAARRADRKWITAFLRGIQNAASKWNVSICGGDVASTRNDGSVFTLTIAGWVEKKKLCLRSNARPGDLLYATGVFGNSFRSGHHLSFTPRLEAGRFVAGTYARCMIDVSDGILSDAERICASSKASLRLDRNSIPLRRGADVDSALTEGEDYELMFAVPPAKSAKLENSWPFKNVRLSRIGIFAPQAEQIISDMGGRPIKYGGKKGYEHFSS